MKLRNFRQCFEWFEGKLGRIWCLSATLVDGIDGVCGMPKAVIYYCIALALVFLNVKPQCLKTTEKVALNIASEAIVVECDILSNFGIFHQSFSN